MKKIFILLSFINICFSFTPQEEKQLLRDIAEIKATLKMFMRETDKRFEQVDKRFEQVDKRIAELREDMNARFELIDKRFEEINKRFEQIDKRFEQIDKKFEQVNERFNDLINFLWIITGIFTTIMVATLGFAWWDRRTIIRKAREETIDYIERETKPEKLRKILNVLRERAKTDKELMEILKREGLL